ncbi:MAG TPA: hypothetical protein VFP64_10375 [Pyrinomonadaceae bacterium]|nr:hypothetical protein [Pyrinomonadaceae bacterium]
MKRRIILSFLILFGLALAVFFSQSRFEKSVAQGNQPPNRGSTKGIKPVPVTADVEMQETRILANGNLLERKTEGKYFRDGQGRVRREQAGLITITDPTTAHNFVLNPKSNLATRLLRPSTPPAGSPPTQQPQSNVMVTNQRSMERSSLGTRTIEGIAVSGKEFVSIIPANSRLGNREPIEVIFEIWTSDELQLPLLTIVKDPLNGDRTQRYVNIRKGVEPDPTLFRVPKGYNVVEAGPVRR